jgi:hypothetical protein
MQELKSLCDNTDMKVSQLAEIYGQMKEEYFVLKQKNRELKDIINRLELKIKMQSEQLVRCKLGEKVKNDEKYTDVKLKINELVREIDTCMRLLNE